MICIIDPSQPAPTHKWLVNATTGQQLYCGNTVVGADGCKYIILCISAKRNEVELKLKQYQGPTIEKKGGWKEPEFFGATFK